MKHTYFASLAGVALLTSSFTASADALHGFCADCAEHTIGGAQVTSTATNPPANFGFWSRGRSGLTGDYLIDILTPDNGGAAPSLSYSVSGGANGTATASLFNSTAWTSQGTKLDSYLGLSASPQNPLNAWLPATKTLDAGAMGYWVFQANLGTNTLGTASGTGPLLNLGSSLPAGSVIVAFLSSGAGKVTGTANSGALFEGGKSGTTVPEPGTMALFGAGLAGLALLRTRRRTRCSA